MYLGLTEEIRCGRERLLEASTELKVCCAGQTRLSLHLLTCLLSALERSSDQLNHICLADFMLTEPAFI
jgi:hypothetical protein